MAEVSQSLLQSRNGHAAIGVATEFSEITNHPRSRLEEFIFAGAEKILREPNGILRHPFFVPGGIFHDELWDWDSFWIAKGILPIRDQLPGKLGDVFLEHAIGSWKNFFEHQAPNGVVPIMVKSDNPDFFGCSNKNGIETNQAKPVFAQFAVEISKALGDSGWIAPYFDGLLKFYDRWISRYQVECGLLVWGSDVAIGVDCDPTTYGRPEFSSANLLLNCLFHQDLEAAAEIAATLNRLDDARELRDKAEALKLAIQAECWDETDGFFYTVDVQTKDHRSHYLPGLRKGMDMSWRTTMLKTRMFTGFLPMWCGIASKEQAQRMVAKYLQGESEFNGACGLRSMTRNDRNYDPQTNSANPSNWLGPVWLVASFMVYQGLRRYGYETEASELADKTRRLLENDLKETGTLHECYNPDTGAPNFNADFLSWNVLALTMK